MTNVSCRVDVEDVLESALLVVAVETDVAGPHVDPGASAALTMALYGHLIDQNSNSTMSFQGFAPRPAPRPRPTSQRGPSD
jgi:hypothetical protein